MIRCSCEQRDHQVLQRDYANAKLHQFGIGQLILCSFDTISQFIANLLLVCACGALSIAQRKSRRAARRRMRRRLFPGAWSKTSNCYCHPGRAGGTPLDIRFFLFIYLSLFLLSISRVSYCVLSFYGEEFEGAALDLGWPGVEGEDIFLIEGGGRLDPAIGGEIGEEALEAVHLRPSSVRPVVCLRFRRRSARLWPRCWRALRRRPHDLSRRRAWGRAWRACDAQRDRRACTGRRGRARAARSSGRSDADGCRRSSRSGTRARPGQDFWAPTVAALSSAFCGKLVRTT